MRYDVIQVAGYRINIAVPETIEEAARGLLNTMSLSDSTGLSYNPAPTLHTYGMLMPIDVLWLDENGQLVAFDEMVPPAQLISPKSIWAVEVAGGWCARNLR